jgi:aspartate kinase
MSVIVQKYGGSSVADVQKIKKIAELIASIHKVGYNVAVVVSAMGKTTDELITLAKSLSDNPPKREMDMLLSTGERVSMSLLCIALNELGVDAISLTGSQAGIITNDRHTDARVIEVRPFRVQDELEKGKVVVIGGFQGVSYKRDITTLGRGGSDTSAVALAAALNAERCEIYSDVDGVYTADPSLIKSAKHLPEISYQQMQEMSSAGAKVLNAQAVQFAKEAKIVIHARSTFSSERETIIHQLKESVSTGVKAVVYEHDIVRVNFTEVNKFDKLLNYLESKQVQIKELNYLHSVLEEKISKVSFALSSKNIIGWDNIERELISNFGNSIKIEKHLGAVSLIGEGMNRDNSILLDAFELLKSNNINVLGITTTSFRISLLIDSDSVEECVRICHEKWIENRVEIPSNIS